jgi:hypothetical protein
MKAVSGPRLNSRVVIWEPIYQQDSRAQDREAPSSKVQGEVLALRRQVQVLERKVKRVRWIRRDRMIVAALHERLPR